MRIEFSVFGSPDQFGDRRYLGLQCLTEREALYIMKIGGELYGARLFQTVAQVTAAYQ